MLILSETESKTMNLLSFFSKKPRESAEEKELFNVVMQLNLQHRYGESIVALKDKPRWIAKNARLKIIYSDSLFAMAESIQMNILKGVHSKEEETQLNKSVIEYFRESVKQGKQAKEAKNYNASFNVMRCYFFGLGLNVNLDQALRYGAFCWDKVKDERVLPYLSN